MIKIIAAISENGVIGKNGDLIFKHAEDLKHFKAQTTNNVIIMGRKTWESIGSKPLPNRTNIILSKNNIISGENHFSILNIDEIPMIAKEYHNKHIFIIGGGEIYKQTINIADELIITQFNEFAEGDTHFPQIDRNVWMCKYIKYYPDFIIKTYRKRWQL